MFRRYLPRAVLDRVSVVGADASSPRFAALHGEGTFDRVLVDAPCSSERHLLHQSGEMLTWAPGRSKGGTAIGSLFG